MAKGFGVEPLAEVELVPADDRSVRVVISLAYFKVLDREGVFQLVNIFITGASHISSERYCSMYCA